MHVFADLGAAANGGPGVDHGAFINIGADVDVRRHQDGTFGNIAAAPRNGGWHHAHASGLHLGLVQVREFGGYLVVKTQVSRTHDLVVFEPETQQYGFFDPLVYRPLANAFAGCHTDAAGVEFGDDVFNGLQRLLWR